MLVDQNYKSVESTANAKHDKERDLFHAVPKGSFSCASEKDRKPSAVHEEGMSYAL